MIWFLRQPGEGGSALQASFSASPPDYSIVFLVREPDGGVVVDHDRFDRLELRVDRLRDPQDPCHVEILGAKAKPSFVVGSTFAKNPIAPGL